MVFVLARTTKRDAVGTWMSSAGRLVRDDIPTQSGWLLDRYASSVKATKVMDNIENYQYCVQDLRLRSSTEVNSDHNIVICEEAEDGHYVDSDGLVKCCFNYGYER